MKLLSLYILSSVLLLSSNASPLTHLEQRTLEKRASPPPTDPVFIKNVLNNVNGIRRKHAAAALTWDASLASFALIKSNGCKLDHTPPYGENVRNFWSSSPPDFTVEVKKAFDWWIRPEEVNAYKAGNIEGAYHFTQTVWKASKKIGCAWSTNQCTRNPNKDWWFYCEFNPPGNISPYYRGNVTV